nr:hypothetical protein BaRGS_027219 [Batillaria attramentaria]
MISVAQQQAAEAERNKRALQGCLTDLPPEQSHSIRVFFSSTFTDMTTERNLLMKEAVPHLRDYCKEKELDFQVVDMRWGIREDASIEHTTTELCLKEIQNCQQTSRGPNFVAFLGDKYGSRTLPITIPVTEYRTLRRLASWMDQDFKAVNKWYLVDTNSVPPVYKIQPITALLPNYNDPDPKKRLLREQHRQTWDRDQKSMLTALRRVSVQAHARKLISDEAFMKYYISVTHDEVLQGVDRGARVQNKVLSFHRSFNIINIEDNIAKRFTDLTSEGEVDEEAKQLREDLKTGTVPKYLTPDQIISNEIEWTSDGIDENNSDHKAYLRTFCDTFTARMMEMIDRSSQSSKKLGFNKAEGLDQEVRVHLRFCREKCETFFGRDAILQRIHSDLHKVEKPDQDMPENATDTPRNLEPEKSDLRTQRDQEIQGMLEMMKKMGCTFSFGDAYDDMESDPNRDIQEEQTSLPKLSTLKFKHPTIIHGVSGSGKTALMAKIVQVSKRWISHSYCIIRFMGATPASSGIHQVLVGIVIHLWQLYKINDPRGLDMLMDFHYLVPYFHTLLWRINSAANPLFLLFDSADQLDSSDYAHTLSWLPRVLPPDVHVFVSMADDHPTCLQNIRYLLPSTDRYIQLGALDKSSADKMIRCVCHRAGRTLTAAQRSLLLQKFENNPQALYLRMITDQSLSWRSNMKAKKLTVADTVEGTIHQLFDTLEKDHGEVVVSHAMAYLTLSPQGLSDSQMEDILSLDDEVLQDTYIFHLPPDPQLIRFASSIWLRIKDDLGDYLAQHRAGKIIMYTWYHRHFHETALQRYGTRKDLSEEIQKKVKDIQLIFDVIKLALRQLQWFLVMQVYEKLSKYDPSFHYMMFEGGVSAPFKFDRVVVALSIASHGQDVAFAYKEEARVHIGSPDTTSRTVLVKHHVSTEASVSLVLFSPSGSDVVVIDSKYNMLVWNEAQHQVSPRPSQKENKFHFKKPKPEEYRITQSNLLLVAFSKGLEATGVKVIDLVTMKEKYFLTNDQLKYAISIMEFDPREEFVAVASKETTIINGNQQRACLVWRLSTGGLTSVIDSNEAWQAVKLIGDEFLTCLASHSYKGVIQIVTLGPRDYPYPEGHLICELNQHSNKMTMLCPFGTESGVVAYNKLEPESSLGEPVEVTSDLPPVHLMLMSRKGDHLIAAAENTLAVFDVKTAKLLYTKPSISGKRKVDCLAEGGGTAIAGHSGMEGKERVASLAVMQPNMELRQILTGGRELKDVPEAMEQAQACALAFSSQRIQKVTTAACVIL